ncbi:hypothetical protein HUU40_15130 [candidate division KSB1 bacterium]|nr:hypothetical protein [candidate division KSB1 bacterium]
MKTTFALLSSAVVLFSCVSLLAQTNVIGPPNALQWGMSYAEAKGILKEKKIELDDLKYEKKYKLPEGFKVAQVGKYEILGRKTDNNLACFNADGELCAFQINFRFGDSDYTVAKSKARKFWEEELKDAIVGKYSGEGFKQHNDPDPDGNIPEVAFRDEVGNEVGVFFQQRKELIGGSGWICIYYTNEEIAKSSRAQLKATDKF